MTGVGQSFSACRQSDVIDIYDWPDDEEHVIIHNKSVLSWESPPSAEHTTVIPLQQTVYLCIIYELINNIELNVNVNAKKLSTSALCTLYITIK